jgi:hypothetical protein
MVPNTGMPKRAPAIAVDAVEAGKVARPRGEQPRLGATGAAQAEVDQALCAGGNRDRAALEAITVWK